MQNCYKCDAPLDGASPTYCKNCAALLQREWRKKNPKRSKEINKKSYSKNHKRWDRASSKRWAEIKGYRSPNHNLNSKKYIEKMKNRDFINIPSYKICPSCKEKLPKERFSLNRQRKDGLHHICRKCRKLKRKLQNG